MTGGQPIEGALTVPQIVRQVAAEGVERIEAVTDEPWKRTGALKGCPTAFPCVIAANSTRCSATCATMPAFPSCSTTRPARPKKRRRRKRGILSRPAKRVVTNDRVCEGCSRLQRRPSRIACRSTWSRPNTAASAGDRSVLRATRIFPASKAFARVSHRARRRPAQGQGTCSLRRGTVSWDLTEPAQPALDHPYGILVTGVGGTGVVTIGALLGTAATMEGSGATVLDMVALRRKAGRSGRMSASARIRTNCSPRVSRRAKRTLCWAAMWW